MKKHLRIGGSRFYPIRHLILLALAIFWLIPIIWLVLNSFSTSNAMSISHFFPQGYTLDQYRKLLFQTDAANQFPTWMLNTTIIPARKPLMNLGMIITLFPGFLSMIAIYFIMKTFNMTNSHLGLILVYSGSSGLGYLIAKGFFDTIPVSMSEAAKLDGASENLIFWKIIVPMSKPIIVYTIINSFLAPWMDFIFAKIMLNSGIASDWTVALGLFGMLDRSRKSVYFGQFCAGGVLVSIPISILFVIMQKFYVEGITGGSTKG